MGARRVARIVTWVLVAACSPAACSPPAEPPTTDAPPPAREAPKQEEPAQARPRPSARGADPDSLRADGLLMAGDPGAWLPPRPLLERAVETLAGGDEELDATLEALPEADRVELLRAGLRLPDESALRAAARLGHAYVDHWESGRVVALLRREVMRPGTAADFEEFRGMIGGAELDAFYAELPEGEWEYDVGVLDQLHRSQTGHHAAVLARLALSPRTRLAQEAVDELGLLVRYTDRARDDVARALLGAEAAAGIPDSADVPDGLPPLLVACLRLLVPNDVLPRFPEIDLAQEGYHDWALRWLGDSVPVDRDAVLLVELFDAAGKETGNATLDALRDFARHRLVLAMAHVGDRGTLAILDALRKKPRTLGRLANYSLAVRGDARALRELRRSADDDGTSFALLLEGFPDDALALAREALRDEAGVAFLAATLPDAYGARRVFALEWPGHPLDRLAADLESPRVGLHAAPLAAYAIPACRTEAAARAWLARIPAEKQLAALHGLAGLVAASLESQDGPGVLDFAAWLETTQPDAFRRALHLATQGGDPDRAWELLLRLGDTAHAEQLVGWYAAHGRKHSPRLLARARAPAAIAFLRDEMQRAGADDVGGWTVALAMAEGIAEEVAESLFGQRAQTAGEVPDEAMDALLEGRGADAVAAVITRYPNEPFWGVGAVRDARVTAYLTRLQRERHLGLYSWATAQLAVQGDDAAWEETHAVFRTGRYRWIDDLGTQEYTRGGDLSLVPEWIEQQESNCCRVATTDEVFEDLFGGGRSRWPWGESGRGETFVRSYRWWWEDCGGEFAWSRLLDRYLPVHR